MKSIVWLSLVDYSRGEFVMRIIHGWSPCSWERTSCDLIGSSMLQFYSMFFSTKRVVYKKYLNCFFPVHFKYFLDWKGKKSLAIKSCRRTNNLFSFFLDLGFFAVLIILHCTAYTRKLPLCVWFSGRFSSSDNRQLEYKRFIFSDQIYLLTMQLWSMLRATMKL